MKSEYFVPKDWCRYEINEIIEVSKTKIDPKKIKINLPCIELDNIVQKTGKINGFYNIDEKLSIKSVFDRGDVLYGKLRPYLRKFYFADFKGACSTEILVLKPKKHVLREFIFNLVQTERFNYYSNRTCGTRMPRVDWKYLSSVVFDIPPKNEQDRIVEVVKTWDQAIEKLEKKIELKKNIKLGLMQQLLTGERRLPGFSGEWKSARLSELCSISRGGSPRPIRKYLTHNPEGLNWLRIGDVSLNSKYIDSTSSKIIPEGLNKTTQVDAGDFILSNSMSFGRPYIMKISACIHDGWLALKGLVSDLIDKDYLYYLLSISKVQNKFKSISAGSGVLNLKKESVSSVILVLPNINEQKEISAILNSVDCEVSLLENKLLLLNNQKKHLLNNLVTGKIRTPENLLEKVA